MTLRRVIHAAKPGGGYRQIPLELRITTSEGRGRKGVQTLIRVNGVPVSSPTISTIETCNRLEIELIRAP